MWELRNILLINLLSLYLYSPLKTVLFPQFSYKVLGGLPRLVWSQRSCSVSLFSQLWEHFRASTKWESISLGLSGSVGIKGHAMAEAVAEAPNGVARALLYIVGASPSFLLHPSYKLFYHTFNHTQSVPFVEPALLVQPLVVESALLPVQSNSFVVKLALSFQTVESGLPALPLIEPVPLASPVPVLSTEFMLQATIESNPPTLSIIQEALEMQVLTEQNVEEKEAVYNEKCFWKSLLRMRHPSPDLLGSHRLRFRSFSRYF